MFHVKPYVIVLNGIGSVGKSTTAKSLQRIAALPFLHVSMDSFIEMLPTRSLDHEDGMTLRVTEQDGHRTITIRSGILMDRLMRGMRHAIAAMASEDNHLIVDDVMFDVAEADLYRRLLRTRSCASSDCSRRCLSLKPANGSAETVRSVWPAASTGSFTGEWTTTWNSTRRR